jgi:hypothetical protein
MLLLSSLYQQSLGEKDPSLHVTSIQIEVNAQERSASRLASPEDDWSYPDRLEELSAEILDRRNYETPVRKSFRCSQEVSAIKRQPWQALP